MSQKMTAILRFESENESTEEELEYTGRVYDDLTGQEEGSDHDHSFMTFNTTETDTITFTNGDIQL